MIAAEPPPPDAPSTPPPQSKAPDLELQITHIPRLSLSERTRFWIAYGTIAATLVAVLSVIFVFSEFMLTDPLGGPILEPKPFNSERYGQTIGQLTSSIADTNVQLVLGLFLMTGFALGFDAKHTRRHLKRQVIPLCVFAASSMLTVFFAIKFKAGLLAQIQFDKVNIVNLQPAYEWHMYCLLVSALSCFVIVFLCFDALSGEGEPKS